MRVRVRVRVRVIVRARVRVQGVCLRRRGELPRLLELRRRLQLAGRRRRLLELPQRLELRHLRHLKHLAVGGGRRVLLHLLHLLGRVPALG